MSDYVIPGYNPSRTTDPYAWVNGFLKREPWRDDAACAEFPPHMWFPEHGKSTEDTANARRICASCPVRVQCLDAGLGERYGIWGGLDRTKRDRIRLKSNTKEKTA